MRFLASILTLALWCASIVAAYSGALTIADKSVFHAQRRDTVFMLIDLWPQHQVIEALPVRQSEKRRFSTRRTLRRR